MYKDIRKISIGGGFPNKSIHYQIGGSFNFNGKSYTIHSITEDILGDRITYNIYLSDGESSVLWKSFTDMPVAVEYNIDFE